MKDESWEIYKHLMEIAKNQFDMDGNWIIYRDTTKLAYEIFMKEQNGK